MNIKIVFQIICSDNNKIYVCAISYIYKLYILLSKFEKLHLDDIKGEGIVLCGFMLFLKWLISFFFNKQQYYKKKHLKRRDKFE